MEQRGLRLGGQTQSRRRKDSNAKDAGCRRQQHLHSLIYQSLLSSLEEAEWVLETQQVAWALEAHFKLHCNI